MKYQGAEFDWELLESNQVDDETKNLKPSEIQSHSLDETSTWPSWVSNYLSHLNLERSDWSKHLSAEFLSLPSAWDFAQMKPAIERVKLAIERQELIAVHGDYDCDGVCSSAIVFDALKRLGSHEPILYLPHREKEGYGLNSDTVKNFIDQGITLIITTDCGSSNVKEIAQAKLGNCDVIIVDHHQRPPVPPEAYAILNSAWPEENFPFKSLCATGVAWFFVSALLEAMGSSYSPKWYLDLVAIATVGDLMPILGVNRILVKYGLKVLSQAKRPGLKALMQVAGIKAEDVTAENIAFGLVPRLNAAGRLEHANGASALVLALTDADAILTAGDLDRTNSDRQRQTGDYVELAKLQLPAQAKLPARVIVGEAWPHGLLGLIAGRICEQTSKPTVVLSLIDGKYTASGRSPKNINIMEVLNANQELLEKFGGHPQACGFTLKSEVSPEQWTTAFQTWAATVPPAKSKKTLNLSGSILNSERQEALRWQEKLAPFGHQAPLPLFLIGPVSLLDVKDLGSTGKHLAFRVMDQKGEAVRAILFHKAQDFKSFIQAQSAAGQYYFAVALSRNDWRGVTSVEYHVKDWCYVA